MQKEAFAAGIAKVRLADTEYPTVQTADSDN